MKKIEVITSAIFFREKGQTSVFISNDEECLNEKVAELEFKGFQPDISKCMYKWRDGLYLRTSVGAPWAEFKIPIDKGATR